MLFVKVRCLSKSTKFRDWHSGNDLFVIIKYGNDIRRTTVKWDEKNPCWNESFVFELSENKNIIFGIYDEDNYSKSDKIHEYSVPIKFGEIKSYKTKFLEIEMGDTDYSHNKEMQDIKSELKLMSMNIESLMSTINKKDEKLQKNLEKIGKIKSDLLEKIVEIEDVESSMDNSD